MSTKLKNSICPFDVGNSDTYNQLQIDRVAQVRYQPTAKPLADLAENSLRVLIVDDHRDGTKILAMLVNAWGHDCRVAFDGATGLESAADFQPDVVMLDLAMPNGNGIELTAQLRQRACFTHCLIVAVTGCTDAGTKMQVEDAGANLFLIKPVCPAVLQTLLSMEAAYLASSQPTTTLPPSSVPPTSRQPVPLKVIRVPSRSSRKVSLVTLTT